MVALAPLRGGGGYHKTQTVTLRKTENTDEKVDILDYFYIGRIMQNYNQERSK